MRILLVNPPSNFLIRTNLPAKVEAETFAYPPLGLMYIASFLLAHARHQVEIFDAQGADLCAGSLKGKIADYLPDIVGIYTSTFNLLNVLLIAKAIKEINNKVLICLGGPHLTVFPEETIVFPEIDYAVVGEGEMAFKELVDSLEDNVDLSKIKGLIFKDKGKIIKNDHREFIDDLDMLPFPARHLVKDYNYGSLLSSSSFVTGLISSRGCHYKCAFCSRKHMGEKIRARSPLNLIGEIKECLRLGVKEIIFYDENFNFDRNRTLEICDRIIKEKLVFKWQIKTRVDLIDEEVLIKLKQAGCQRIHYGAESGNSRILEALNKNISLTQLKKIACLTHKSGIETLFYFMIGSPGETKADVIATIKFAISLNPDYAYFSILTPFPGTELYKIGITNKIFDDYWKRFAVNPNINFKPKFFTEKIREEELYVLLKYAYKSFYFRPRYLFKRIRLISGVKELLVKAQFAFRLLEYTNFRPGKFKSNI